MSARAYAFVPSSAHRRHPEADLPLWLGDELWEVEPVPRRVEEWGPGTAAEFAAACAARARAVARPDAPFGDLYAADAETFAAGIADQDPARAARNAAAVALIAREAAAHAAESTGESAREAELAWQARWIAQRLGFERV